MLVQTAIEAFDPTQQIQDIQEQLGIWWYKDSVNWNGGFLDTKKGGGLFELAGLDRLRCPNTCFRNIPLEGQPFNCKKKDAFNDEWGEPAFTPSWWPDWLGLAYCLQLSGFN